MGIHCGYWVIHMTEPSKRPTHLTPAADALWDWIEKKGFNQREAAKVLGFPWITLNHYLHNRRRPGLERLEHLFNVTGIPMALWLDTRVGKPKKRLKPTATKRQYLQAGNANVA